MTAAGRHDSGGIFNRHLELATGDLEQLARADLFLAIAYDADIGAGLLQQRRLSTTPPIPIIALFGSTGRDPAPPGSLALYPGSAQRRQALTAFATRELGIQPEEIVPSDSGTTLPPAPAAVLLIRLGDLQTALPGLLQQLWYLAAAELLASVLADSGRELTTEKFLTSLQSRHRYPGGWGPPLTFGPDRTIGHDPIVVLRLLPVSSTPGEQNHRVRRPEPAQP